MMSNKAYPFYFVGGALVLYVLFFVLPSLMGFFYAFTDWSSYSADVNFVGLDNFALIFSADQGYLHYISNTLIFTFVTIVLKTVIALGLAVLLTQGVRRLAHLHRVVMYLPAVLPMLAVSFIFKSILNPADGLLNTIIARCGTGLSGAEMVGGRVLGDAVRHRRGYLEGRRLYHGDPDRRHPGDPARIL